MQNTGPGPQDVLGALEDQQGDEAEGDGGSRGQGLEGSQ